VCPGCGYEGDLIQATALVAVCPDCGASISMDMTPPEVMP
jgi:DNA-directed RNA polymerase subunit RPC12/RpoP